MLLSIKNTAIAATAAIAMLAAPVTPAQAWGKNEQNFLKGVLATVAVGTVVNQVQRQRRAAPQVTRQPVYQQPVYQQPVYAQPVYAQPVYAPAPQYVSVYGTPAARAFMSYPTAERRLIQRRLAVFGYYRGGIDGAFGPGTYAAINAYAREQGQAQRLASMDSAFAVYDGLIY